MIMGQNGQGCVPSAPPGPLEGGMDCELIGHGITIGIAAVLCGFTL